MYCPLWFWFVLQCLVETFLVLYSLARSCMILVEIVQGVQKKMRRSFCLISLATNMLEGKVGSIASFGVQKLFCTIFWSRDISKVKWLSDFKMFKY